MTANCCTHITVPSRLDHLDLLQAVAEEVARLAGLDDDARLDFGLAVREGAVNAMKHAHRLEPAHPVRCLFRQVKDGVEASIRDEGPGFDPAATPDPRAPENLLRSSGRGLFLIRSLVDRVDFVRHRDDGEAGMELVLFKGPGVRRAASAESGG